MTGVPACTPVMISIQNDRSTERLSYKLCHRKPPWGRGDSAGGWLFRKIATAALQPRNDICDRMVCK